MMRNAQYAESIQQRKSNATMLGNMLWQSLTAAFHHVHSCEPATHAGRHVAAFLFVLPCLQVGYAASKEVFGRTWHMSISAGETGPVFTVGAAT
jgi:hypothetical protein